MEDAPPSVKTGGTPARRRELACQLAGLLRRGDLTVNRIMMWSMLLVDWAQRKFTGRGDAGASLVEYALLLALIAVVAIGAIFFLGNSVNNQLNKVANVINQNSP
jgi:pilus assembly protein Flp/PilA